MRFLKFFFSATTSLQVVFTLWAHLISSKTAVEATCVWECTRLYACGEHMCVCVRALMWFMCMRVCDVSWCEREPAHSCMRVLVCFGHCLCACVCVCVNSKLTAAVKFLSEHHRGEADGSWQGARVKGGGRGRWRWAWSRGRWWLPASLMIEGSVRLCRNSVLLSKNTDAFTVIVLTLSSVTHRPWMYLLRVKQLFPVNISRWCWGLAFRHCWNYCQLSIYRSYLTF